MILYLISTTSVAGVFRRFRFPTEEISRARPYHGESWRVFETEREKERERTDKHSNYLGGETSVDGVPPFQRQHGGMIGASTGSYVYPRICGSFFFFFSLAFSPIPLPPSPLFLPSLPRLPIHSGGSAVSQRCLSRASLILRPFPGRFTWLDSAPQWRKLSIFISSFRIFLGVTSLLQYT